MNIETIYKQHSLNLYKFVFLRVRSKEIAEDIISEVFLKYLMNRNTVKDVKPWLYKVAYNLIIDRSRTRKDSMPIDEVVSEESTFLDEMIKNEESKLVVEALTKLAEKQQDSIYLKYYGDYKNKDIAKLLKVSEKTVSSNLKEAYDNLKKYLNWI